MTTSSGRLGLRRRVGGPWLRVQPYTGQVALRRVTASDLTKFYGHAQDPEARAMSAVGSPSTNFAAFRARWTATLAQPTNLVRTVVVGRRVAGYVCRFPLFGRPSVAYWYDRSYWGRGIATRALHAFLRIDRTRPVFARVAYDNWGSRRVLEKCGFVVVGRTRTYAAQRKRRLTEVILRLAANSVPAARGARVTRPSPGRPPRSGSRGA